MFRALRHPPASSSARPWIARRCRPGRRYATVTDLARYPSPGDALHGFTLKRAQHVPELHLSALHLEHDRTGAQYLHVARDDRNNVFSIGFKTNPPDDTGVPHILEHTTLCGSRKYPIRDPFFKMLPRTLSNFMNAFTSSDHTYYPFATTNARDFSNLMSVYLDATLHPLLKPNDFAQEGWRIGPQNPGAPDRGPLVFKGVVYNEMKGQMSDAGYLYYIRFQDHLFPAIHNSGGDPQKMTDLTYQQLRDFHTHHYHPSNARIFTYGDMPLAAHLEAIGVQLDAFGKRDVDREIKRPIALDGGPHVVTVPGPIDTLVDADMQYKTSTSWLMGDTSDPLETFALGIMSSLLLDGYGSPLYRSLIEAGLGPDWTPNTGFDGGGKIGVFSVGLSGVKADDVRLVRETIQRTLQTVHETGFDQSKVDGLLHQLELALKHKTASFGMSLMQRLQPGWFNGVDPFDSLRWDQTVSAFKVRLAQGDYLEGLLAKYLLNDRTLTFTMAPSATYEKDLAAEEAARLAAKITAAEEQAGGVDPAREQLEQRELDLLQVQETARNEDLSCLPSVHIQDVPRLKETADVRDAAIADIPVQWRATPTNGLTYFRAVNTFAALPDELRVYLPLFVDSMMRLGTRDRSMEQLEDEIKLKTGGIRASYHAATSPTAIERCSEGLAFSGYAFDSNVPAMYDLLRTLVLETDFDGPAAEAQIRQLLQGAASGSISAIAESGHAYARRAAEAQLTRHGRWQEDVSGLTQVQLTASLASRPSAEGLGDVVERLKAIQRFALAGGSRMRAAITCGPESVRHNEYELQRFLQSLPAGTYPAPLASSPHGHYAKTFVPLPYQVYYSALALPTVPYTHPASASLQILAQLLTHKHLHHEIREKGGAYGGGAYAKGLGGVFGFYSYRDPNPNNTIQLMQSAGRWGRERAWTAQDLAEAKLSVFQGLDAPESVSEEGMVRFLHGVSDEMAQRRREQLLDVTADDVTAAADQFLVKESDAAILVVLGEQKPSVTDDAWHVQEMVVPASTDDAPGATAASSTA
ncbi:MAG: Mitochondrial presequence protease [Thelocarpon superellum]|nr:MAG: Mitochondrial presequence protease [Thelocarpon superellum]